MENYKRYKEAYPNKTDAQIIESLAWELKDKVETIHRLLNELKSASVYVVQDSDGVVQSAHLTEDSAEQERTKLRSGLAPRVDFTISKINIS